MRHILLAALMFGVLDNGVLSLISGFAIQNGHSALDASTLAATGLIGALLFQIPAGRLSGISSVDIVIAPQFAGITEQVQVTGMKLADGWKFVPKPRPTRDVQLRTWAWRAMNDGNVPVARKHAVALWKAAPLSVESWRTLLCALRGY